MLVERDVGFNDVLRGFSETINRVDAELTADNDEVNVGVVACNGVHIAADSGFEVDDQAVTRFAQLTNQGLALRGVGAFHGVNIQIVLFLAGHQTGIGSVVKALVAQAALLHDHSDLLVDVGLHTGIVGVCGSVAAGVVFVRVAGTGCKRNKHDQCKQNCE